MGPRIPPVLMSELCIRNVKRERVKKDLFGPVNHEDARAFVERELLNLSTDSSSRWNFDFINEKPLNVENARYIWEKIGPYDSIPSPYGLTRLPFLSQNSCSRVLCNNNNVIKEIKDLDLEPEEPLPFKMEVRQTVITDYMPCIKRKANPSTKNTKRLKAEVKNAQF